MDNLRKDIASVVDIGKESLEEVLSGFEKKDYKKGEDFASYGKTANYIQFIEQGLLRVYFLDGSSKEITIQIGMEKTWVNNLNSFINRTPSEFYIDVLAPTTIYQLHKNALERFFTDIPKMESYFRLKLEKSYSRLHHRAFGQLNQTAEERYLEFRAKYGQIEPLVPQYIIASYLNITPEHLSKIRKLLNSH